MKIIRHTILDEETYMPLLSYFSTYLADLFQHVKYISDNISRILANKIFCQTFCRKLQDFLPISAAGLAAIYAWSSQKLSRLQKLSM
jgi:hypothetical protein